MKIKNQARAGRAFAQSRMVRQPRHFDAAQQIALLRADAQVFKRAGVAGDREQLCSICGRPWTPPYLRRLTADGLVLHCLDCVIVELRALEGLQVAATVAPGERS